MTRPRSRILPASLAIALIAVGANCFLKYLWWTACYSAWYGIPKMAEQWKAAGSRASFNGWSFLILEGASVAVLYSAIRFRENQSSGLFRTAVRLVLSLLITIAGAAVCALVLSWFKQGMH